MSADSSPDCSMGMLMLAVIFGFAFGAYYGETLSKQGAAECVQLKKAAAKEQDRANYRKAGGE